VKTVKGRVSNLKHDVEVIEPSLEEYDPPSGTSDITTFDLAGRSMRYRSNRPTYASIIEGDELIVAGIAKGTIFEVSAYRNVTKNLNSYGAGKGGVPILKLMAIVLLLLALGFGALMYFLSGPLMALLLAGFLIAVSVYLFLLSKKQSDAIKLLESYK
jgi:hypothetical protein